MNKRKILNDPVYGFINIPSDFLFDLIEHPWFQRLRRIRQLGLAEFVYPGALHTRFHHALGAMHLMGEALQTLSAKGNRISDEEWEAARAAILLHDIGHGPFSHVLEYVLLSGVPHEQISLVLMEELNTRFDGRLELAIQMFKGNYYRKFFHQLISSQLDMDRMDYLNRDCFYTGVVEGAIGTDRLIKMLDLSEDQLVVEEKGLLSIENFLNARRTMYWQVYLHKTALCAENMLAQIIRRARELIAGGEELFASPVLKLFLSHRFTIRDFRENPEYVRQFTQLDDLDLWAAIKVWTQHRDPVLAAISEMLLNRNLYKISFFAAPPTPLQLETIYESLRKQGVPDAWHSYFSVAGSASNSAYIADEEQIQVRMKNGSILDIAAASELPTIKALSKIVTKFYVCWPKTVSLRE